MHFFISYFRNRQRHAPGNAADKPVDQLCMARGDWLWTLRWTFHRQNLGAQI
jgi:hypothetical protein